MKKKYLANNDVYLICTFPNGSTVTNDNYNGLIVFDKNFEIEKKISIGNDVIFDYIYNAEYIILFTCYEKKLFFCYDYCANRMFSIPMKQYSDVFFLNQFSYKDGHFYLFDREFNCYNIDTQSCCVMECSKENLLNNHIFTSKLILKPTYDFNMSAQNVIYRVNSTLIKVVDLSSNMEYEFICEDDSHAFDYLDGYFLEVGERLAICHSPNGDFRVLPKENYMYMRGELSKTTEGLTLTLLSGDKGNNKNSLIEKIYFVSE